LRIFPEVDDNLTNALNTIGIQNLQSILLLILGTTSPVMIVDQLKRQYQFDNELACRIYDFLSKNADDTAEFTDSSPES